MRWWVSCKLLPSIRCRTLVRPRWNGRTWCCNESLAANGLMLQDAKHGQQVWFQMIQGVVPCGEKRLDVCWLRLENLWPAMLGCSTWNFLKMVCRTGGNPQLSLMRSNNSCDFRVGRFLVGRGFCNSTHRWVASWWLLAFSGMFLVWFPTVMLKTPCKYWFQVEFPGIFGH